MTSEVVTQSSWNSTTLQEDSTEPINEGHYVRNSTAIAALSVMAFAITFAFVIDFLCYRKYKSGWRDLPRWIAARRAHSKGTRRLRRSCRRPLRRRLRQKTPLEGIVQETAYLSSLVNIRDDTRSRSRSPANAAQMSGQDTKDFQGQQRSDIYVINDNVDNQRIDVKVNGDCGHFASMPHSRKIVDQKLSHEIQYPVEIYTKEEIEQIDDQSSRGSFSMFNSINEMYEYDKPDYCAATSTLSVNANSHDSIIEEAINDVVLDNCQLFPEDDIVKQTGTPSHPIDDPVDCGNIHLSIPGSLSQIQDGGMEQVNQKERQEHISGETSSLKYGYGPSTSFSNGDYLAKSTDHLTMENDTASPEQESSQSAYHNDSLQQGNGRCQSITNIHPETFDLIKYKAHECTSYTGIPSSHQSESTSTFSNSTYNQHNCDSNEVQKDISKMEGIWSVNGNIHKCHLTTNITDGNVDKEFQECYV